MHLILSDDDKHLRFAPLTLTRPLGELRMGLFTFAERWKMLLKSESVSYETSNPFLSGLYDQVTSDSNHLKINARVIPSEELIQEILTLKSGEALFLNETWIAQRGAAKIQREVKSAPTAILENRWDLYLKNDQVLNFDFSFYTRGRKSALISSTNTLLGNKDLIFLEPGAKVEASILNSNFGPIYIGKDAEIMEGSMIRGPFALGESAGVKMGAKIYGATSIGPHCKVGGEISNSIFLAYSNKGHDGFVGNAYIGAWCNIGADTNCSNLKNNYGHVKTYCYETKQMVQTDVTFMGVFMGDHSKCSINTMFNTATVVGVSANIFSSGFPKKVIPSFSWGENLEKFDFDKAIEVAKSMMNRRGIEPTTEEIEMLKRIWDSKNV